jgi:FkbM family methyltransferase
MSTFKHKFRKFLWRFGYDFYRFTPDNNPIARKKRLFQSSDIDVVLDIGANIGQFSQQLRDDIGYTKRIISFEPLSSAFRILKSNAQYDPSWDVLNYALGDVEEKQEINIAGNSDSSSLLEMLPSHIKVAPSSEFIGKEMVEVKKLDSIIDVYCKNTDNIYMKIDTQGYEKKVLEGAQESLKKIDIIQMEMSLVPLYKKELLFIQMCTLMSKINYRLISIEPAFVDPISGQILQVDGIFHRI